MSTMTVMLYSVRTVKPADILVSISHSPPPSSAHIPSCSLNTLIHRRIWTSYKFRKMDGLDRGVGRVDGCHSSTSISPGEQTERVETGQSLCGPWWAVYCPQTTICALEMRMVCTPRFGSLPCQVSPSKSSFSFSVPYSLSPPFPLVNWKHYQGNAVSHRLPKFHSCSRAPFGT